MSQPTPYELYYWAGIQGRGEFVRLALEDAGAPYLDVARDPGKGDDAMGEVLEAGNFPAFAPPALRDGDLLVFQTSNILHYLAPRLGLVRPDEASRVRAHQLQLTIADLVAEAHDVHHPIAVGLYFEDQKSEAKKRSPHFVKERIPKYLRYFEALVARHGGLHVLGPSSADHSYVDLSLFQLVTGLSYAFPRAMERLHSEIPSLHALTARVAKRPGVASYLASPRRLPFNEQGIFRHYPELDVRAS